MKASTNAPDGRRANSPFIILPPSLIPAHSHAPGSTSATPLPVFPSTRSRAWPRQPRRCQRGASAPPNGKSWAGGTGPSAASPPTWWRVARWLQRRRSRRLWRNFWHGTTLDNRRRCRRGLCAWRRAPSQSPAPGPPQVAGTPYAVPVSLRWTAAFDVLNVPHPRCRPPEDARRSTSGARTHLSSSKISAGMFSVAGLSHGAYCFTIRATRPRRGLATAPRHRSGRHGESHRRPARGRAGGRAVSGVVSLAATSADAGCRGSREVVRVGAVGASRRSRAGAVWDTTADGTVPTTCATSRATTRATTPSPP